MMKQENDKISDIEPGQKVEIDFFKPSDAKGVVNLFKFVYGNAYPISVYLNPDELIEANRKGSVISSVARTPKGDIVGHNALFNSAPYKNIYESGSGLVHPAYRGGKGIGFALVAHGQNEVAKRFGIEAIYGEAVCNHVYMQRLVEKLGWVPQAIEVDLMPASTYEKEKSASGRVSSLFYFYCIISKPHKVYLPKRYYRQLSFLYDILNDDRIIMISDKEIPSHLSTKIEKQLFDFAQVARLSVIEIGADFGSVIMEVERELKEKGIIIIQVWLKLSLAWVGEAVDILRNFGYFLGGILPRWFDEDGILMQKVLGKPNWEGINLYTDRSKEIMKFAKEDWMQNHP